MAVGSIIQARIFCRLRKLKRKIENGKWKIENGAKNGL